MGRGMKDLQCLEQVFGSLVHLTHIVEIAHIGV